MENRSAGILLPISSLPSDYGIGCFSKSAYEFVDWLKEAGQTYWQILPLGPTSYGDSPYQSFSTFAGNPYFIDLDTLVEEGVLDKKDCEKVNWGKKPDDVDYEKIYKGRYPLLRKAYENSDISKNPDYQKFVAELVAFRLCFIYGSKGSFRGCGMDEMGRRYQTSLEQCHGLLS